MQTHSAEGELSLLRQMASMIDAELDINIPARESFYDFLRVTAPDMKLNWFNRVLCAKLQQFYEDVVAGLQPRLMIFAPPRHGKSEAASRRFPAWCFGKNPKINFIACSYAAMLASRMNRDVQRIMDSPKYQDIFPNTRLNVENVATVAGKPLRNSEIFEIVGHLGSYRSAGVGGGITGQGFDVGLIDDPVADAQSALSEVYRQSIWEWYQTTFYTRRSPMSGIVLIMTRWHQDDLAGRLLQAQLEGGEVWDIVRFPAIAEEREEFRDVGEPLHPERYSLASLQATQKAIGSYAWEAMYQQHPSPKGGTIFNRSHWKFWKALPTFEEKIISVDCTFKDLKDNDYVAIGVWGRRGADKFLVQRLRERLGFAATVMAIRSIRAQHPDCTAILVEDKANGSAVIETLAREIPGVIAINPEGGKVARAYAIQPEQEAGNLWLPDPTVDHDIETFLAEATGFPSMAHDDEVDQTTQAINWYRNRAGAYGMLDFLRQQSEAHDAQRRAA